MSFDSRDFDDDGVMCFLLTARLIYYTLLSSTEYDNKSEREFFNLRPVMKDISKW